MTTDRSDSRAQECDGSRRRPGKNHPARRRPRLLSALRGTVCYIRDRRDDAFDVAQRARDLGLDYVEITERHLLDPAVIPALRRLVRERHIDIIHSHEYKTDLLALLVARSTGTIPLATVHGWTGHSWRTRHVYYALDKRLLRAFPMPSRRHGRVRHVAANQLLSNLARHGDRHWERGVDDALDKRLLRAFPMSIAVSSQIQRS